MDTSQNERCQSVSHQVRNQWWIPVKMNNVSQSVIKSGINDGHQSKWTMSNSQSSSQASTMDTSQNERCQSVSHQVRPQQWYQSKWTMSVSQSSSQASTMDTSQNEWCQSVSHQVRPQQWYQSKWTMSVNQSSSQESTMDTSQNERCQLVCHQVRNQRWIPVKMNDVSQSVIKSGINDGYQSKWTMSVSQSTSQASTIDTSQNERCQLVSHQVRHQRWIPVKMNDVSHSVIKSGLNDGYQSKWTMSVSQPSCQASTMDTSQNERCQSVSHQVRPQRWIPVKMNDVSQSIIKSGLNDGYQSKWTMSVSQ